MESFDVRTPGGTAFINITREVRRIVAASGVESGLCTVFVPHTTAGVTINENADPAVPHDTINELNKIVPLQHNYTHAEGNSAAHIKAGLMGSSAQVPIEDGEMALGVWQGVFFCEFDGPRGRKVYVQVK